MAQFLVLTTAVVSLVFGSVLLLAGGAYEEARVEAATIVFAEPEMVFIDTETDLQTPVMLSEEALADALCPRPPL